MNSNQAKLRLDQLQLVQILGARLKRIFREKMSQELLLPRILHMMIIMMKIIPKGVKSLMKTKPLKI